MLQNCNKNGAIIVTKVENNNKVHHKCNKIVTKKVQKLLQKWTQKKMLQNCNKNGAIIVTKLEQKESGIA